jgi:hypothetical protein
MIIVNPGRKAATANVSAAHFLVSAAHFIEQLLNPLFQHGSHFFVNNFFVGLVSSYRARVGWLTEA